jgi:anti-sigma factor RsiW
MGKRSMALQNACGEFEADLVLYYYGEGSATERDRVEKHLAACGRCSHFMDDLRTLLPQMSQTMELPQSFWDTYYRETVQKLEQSQERRSWWRSLLPNFGGWAIPAFGTAVIAVLAVTLVFGKGDWSLRSKSAPQVSIPEDILSDSSRLEFFNSLDLLESLPTLEKMDGNTPESVEVHKL